MAEQKRTTEEFAQALGQEVDFAFRNLASLIHRDGALSAKDRALIALACFVAVRCEHCIQKIRNDDFSEDRK